MNNILLDTLAFGPKTVPRVLEFWQKKTASFIDFGRVSSTFDFDVLMLKFEGLQSFRMWMCLAKMSFGNFGDLLAFPLQVTRGQEVLPWPELLKMGRKKLRCVEWAALSPEVLAQNGTAGGVGRTPFPFPKVTMGKSDPERLTG